MMMEDWASGTIVPGYNAIRDARFVTYMTYAGHSSNNCGLTTWTPYRGLRMLRGDDMPPGPSEPF